MGVLRNSTVFLLLLLSAPGSPGLDASERPPLPEPDFRMQGWATVGKGTTGGAGGPTVTVTRPGELVRYMARPEPLIIQVKGTIDMREPPFPGYSSSGRYEVASNKTIIGLGDNARIRGAELRLRQVSNVIIRNLTLSESPDTAIAVSANSTHVWIDHNEFRDAPDGLIDISGGSDFITVSWNRFSDHNKTALIGSGDRHVGDRDHLRVTYHNNWFAGTNQRNPRVRFGQVHLFNNYYERVNVGVGIGAEARIYSEQNHWENATRPFHYYDNPDQPGYMKDSGSLIDGRTIVPLRPAGVDWSPKDHYTYTVYDVEQVRDLARTYTGVGVIAPPVRENAPAPGPDKAIPVGRVAHYPLTEGRGAVARDQSGFGGALNLVLSGGATWLPGGGVALDGGRGRLQSRGPATKLAEQISATGEFTVIVWARPTKADQAGPARLVSHSADHHLRNFTLGQNGSDLVFRLRTSGETDDNGLPEINPGTSLSEEKTHYVVTFDGTTVRIYRNGALEHNTPWVGSLADWDRDYPLVLGNEATGTRGWAGEIFEVVILDHSLSDKEVRDRFSRADGRGEAGVAAGAPPHGVTER